MSSKPSLVDTQHELKIAFTSLQTSCRGTQALVEGNYGGLLQ